MSVPRIAVLSPEKAPYSTTFIKAHLDLLAAEVHHLYGIFFPAYLGNGESLATYAGATRYFHKVKSFGRGTQNKYKEALLAHYLKKERIQLVLAEFGPVGAEVMPVCRQLGIPLIVHFHGFDAYVHQVITQYKERYLAMFHYAEAVIGVSQEMLRQLRTLGVPDEKLVYNCYGPNPAFFEIEPTFAAPHYLAIGRFVDKKAPYLTLAAFREVHKKVPQAKLTMVGDGDLLEVCRALLDGWQLQEAVALRGAVSHDAILAEYADYTCFVQHSIVAPNGDSEGTPVGILEASAAGLPVVATRHAGIPDVIKHEETGFLVAERDIEGMAHFMAEMAIDLEKAASMGAAGRARIRASFTQEQHIQRLDALVTKALDK
ncbi:Glycosyltransferase involved in cell wall bisynthesis [Catalinimonas alkaloidigena]|uniref:Glycosyltransferase involved in cell wall bisynthesis n=1 Tax=Catalinimonas alkaloidigena TaxID=1075417 RepID=A0A1G9LIA0_9BACT|nr:glycosyltransferase [Catalinimonas alkaloidigena]SDL61597.1 Glycosyltransferase involved in cell wall bisynthesis [Catalinimonas alkaloidigena]